MLCKNMRSFFLSVWFGFADLLHLPLSLLYLTTAPKFVCAENLGCSLANVLLMQVFLDLKAFTFFLLQHTACGILVP